jgi:hypothetical protein
VHLKHNFKPEYLEIRPEQRKQATPEKIKTFQNELETRVIITNYRILMAPIFGQSGCPLPDSDFNGTLQHNFQTHKFIRDFFVVQANQVLRLDHQLNLPTDQR